MSNRIEAARESLANRHRETKVTAPLLDSTETQGSTRMVKKVVRRLHYSDGYCYGFRVGLDWKPLTSRDQYSSCAPQTQYPKQRPPPAYAALRS
jgi:hypothetical protein